MKWHRSISLLVALSAVQSVIGFDLTILNGSIAGDREGDKTPLFLISFLTCPEEDLFSDLRRCNQGRELPQTKGATMGFPVPQQRVTVNCTDVDRSMAPLWCDQTAYTLCLSGHNDLVSPINGLQVEAYEYLCKYIEKMDVACIERNAFKCLSLLVKQYAHIRSLRIEETCIALEAEVLCYTNTQCALGKNYGFFKSMLLPPACPRSQSFLAKVVGTSNSSGSDVIGPDLLLLLPVLLIGVGMITLRWTCAVLFETAASSHF